MEVKFTKPREELTFQEAKRMLLDSRGVLVEMLDLALEHGDITQKERDIMYFRLVDWHSLKDTGVKFEVTRERIRQIEGRIELILEKLTKVPEKLNMDKHYCNTVRCGKI